MMKRGRRKGGNKDKVFGCDLMDHLTATSQEIPQVLRSCSIFIEKHGIVDGIYRLSGVSSNTQKLRSEFDSELSPDLYKDLYLQDIHCVSSLCKAYFRELPNPLLTYQLYDHFAEAVAVQLEDERLVKIKEVLKDLPLPHFRTLEYLMKHLIRMAAYSDQTNMHVRNLAIVWAPNLLRSKDIEATGFNGTAAFMEVRVQSIVVEFILSHVTQLFPDSDPELAPTSERRKSLPSPSLSNQDDTFFRAMPFQYPGNLSPGDGPPPMRPYHAIIDGTEKRKGSLKGRKWKSIFNLGGRLHDPRKKKYAPKEKEKNALRPAKSMDSLSTGPYISEESRHGSPHLSPLAMPPVAAEGGPAVSSGYAVTYRRTGGASVSMVSGGGGAQGTYRSLDPGAGANGDKSQIPTQAMPSRAERRAGMHISGPFSVTVPLHITSGLALGVLQGGRAEEEELKQGEKEEDKSKKDKQENVEEKETELDEGKIQTDGKTESLNDDTEKKMEDGEKEVQREDREQDEVMHEKIEESEDKDKGDECSTEEEVSNGTQHDIDTPLLSEDRDGGDYMVMKGGVIKCPEGVEGEYQSFSNLQISTEEESYDPDLTLDFQDTFGFLDMMDMPTSNQMNEFSVEPPAEIEDDEEEDKQSPLQSPSHFIETSQLNLPRPVSNKSQSLPYKASLFQTVTPLSSEDESYSGPSDDDIDAESSDSGKGEYEDMFIKSLPSSHFYELNWTEPPTIMLDSESNVDSHSKSQSESLNQTHVMAENIQDPTPTIHLNDTVMIVSNADDLCLNDSDFSSLHLETDGENDANDRSGVEDLGTIKAPIQEENKEVESTDETPACSHFTEDENEEDTYFGPDPPSITVEESNSGTFAATVETNVINEDPAGSDDQQESTDNHVDDAESETIIDVTSPDVEKTQTETVVQHIHVQEELDGNELEGLVVSEDREVGEGVEEQKDERETKEETIVKEESMESEESERWENDDCPERDDGVQLETLNPTVPQEEPILDVENKEEDVDVEKRKEDGDRGEEDDQQSEEDDVEEEIEAQEDCHLEGVAEIKTGSVPEELSEEDDRLSVDGEEPPIENEKDRMSEENPSRLDREKPVRPPRMKDRDGGGRTGLGLGEGRTVIISKQKIYQVKAVPVVPPKPQHSKITAFRQQFQQRDIERKQKSIQSTCTERQPRDKAIPQKESENAGNRHAEVADVAQNHDHNNTKQEKGTQNDRDMPEENQADPGKKHLKETMSSNSSEGELEQDREEQMQRRGTWDGGSLRKNRQKELDKEAKRASGISMCFDEAVARATGKRYREKESMDKDRFVDQCERSEQKEGLNQRKAVEEEQKTD